jgi:hypothetical protein
VATIDILREIVKQGGGDEMVATSVYESDGQTFCNLICPLTSAAYMRAPVVLGAGSSISAPRKPWPESGVAWETLPRVAVMYVSSQSQAGRTPIVVGVLRGKKSKTLSEVQQQQEAKASAEVKGSTSRTTSPGAKDAALTSDNATIIVREEGHIDNVADKDFVVRAERILLKNKVEPLLAPAIAEQLAAAITPLYDTVNQILKFVTGFPTLEQLGTAAQTSPELVGKVFVANTAYITYEVSGFATDPATGATTPAIVSVAGPYTPYNGAATIEVPSHEQFDAPNVLMSPRESRLLPAALGGSPTAN